MKTFIRFNELATGGAEFLHAKWSNRHGLKSNPKFYEENSTINYLADSFDLTADTGGSAKDSYR